jgi:hypothetical protein
MPPAVSTVDVTANAAEPDNAVTFGDFDDDPPQAENPHAMDTIHTIFMSARRCKQETMRESTP